MSAIRSLLKGPWLLMISLSIVCYSRSVRPGKDVVKAPTANLSFVLSTHV